MSRATISRFHRAALAAALALTSASAAHAQGGDGRPAVELSGVLYGNFQYHVEPGTTPAEDAQVRAGLERSQFSLERAYLTVRAAAGERASVRVTSDLYRADGGYELRLKYGYLDYRFLEAGQTSAYARVGLLQNVMIEHEESFWPRWLGSAPLDRAGFFSSADLGLAVGVTFPHRFGELYAEVVNGQGFQHVGEADDRFKDYAARLTLRPLANLEPAALQALVVSPWYYRGDTASIFGPNSALADAPGYLGPVAEGRRRDRFGIFVGWDDPRLVAGLSVGRRESDVEDGANTASSPVTVTRVSEKLIAAFAVVRPLAFVDGGRDDAHPSPLAIVLRYDRDDADTVAPGRTRYVVAGVAYDLTPAISVALDYQETLPEDGLPATRANTRQVYFAHFQAKF
ncbi:MAG TPA: hypothetical protein VFS08_04910 [Gemmatimonadaceae bacterium]|nr:hypothetical protein [Gemmatimonadaceae bacterium]